jgi:tetratricopeptide (TPR) repeat protein
MKPEPNSTIFQNTTSVHTAASHEDRPRTRRRLAAGTHAEPTSSVSLDPSESALPANRASAPGRRAPGTCPPCATGTVGIWDGRPNRSLRREPSFSTVRVAPAFSSGDYAPTFAALQMPPSDKLLDLTAARMLSADVFEQLARAWTAPADAVPRLAILVTFERWVMLRTAAVAALQPVARRGIQVEVFYTEQAWSGQLPVWFVHGQVVHNVRAAIMTLVARWHPSATWPAVIDTLAQMVRDHVYADERPALLTEVAALALSAGGAEQAAALAREALAYLRPVPSATRSQALRELGAALLSQGQTAAGLTFLDQAIEIASAARASTIGASALCQRGQYALNRGHYPDAERRFRGAIDLLSPATGWRHLLALAHHSLAIALMHQDRADAAEEHARVALALRADPDSHFAEQDRLLLAQLRAVGAAAGRHMPADADRTKARVVRGAPSSTDGASVWALDEEHE